MAKKIRVWDGSAWQDVAPALPYTAIHSAQASMPATGVDGQVWLDTDGTLSDTAFVPLSTIDAKGDLLVGTADNTVSRLASSGTNDQVLTVDTSTATGLKWAIPSAGSYTQLATGSLSGVTTSISSIAGTYTDLRLIILNPYSAGGARARIRVNSDTGSNYDSIELTNGSSQVGNVSSGDHFNCGAVGTTVPNNIYYIINFYDYANGTYKTVDSLVANYNDTPTYRVKGLMGMWRNTNAITSIQINNSNNEDWSGGTYILYGVK